MTRRLLSAEDVYHVTVVATLAAAGALPSARLREQVARRLGWLSYTMSRRKRRLVEGNVTRAFGDRADRRLIVRSSFDDFWREMLCWTSPPSGADARIIGLEHLREALAEGRGAILWESNGFGRRLAAKQILHSLGLAVHQIHGRNAAGNLLVGDRPSTWAGVALVRRFFDRRERRFVAELVYLPVSESLAFTRHLQGLLGQNAILCIAGDGREGRRLVPLEFLGRTVMFAPGMVSLSQLSGAPLLPVFCAPGGDGGLVLTVGPPIRADDSAGREHSQQGAVQQYAAQLETRVRSEPGRYRSWHTLGDRSGDDREREERAG